MREQLADEGDAAPADGRFWRCATAVSTTCRENRCAQYCASVVVRTPLPPPVLV